MDSRQLTLLVHVDCIMDILPSSCRRPKCRLKSFVITCLALGVLGTCLVLTAYQIDIDVISSKRAQVGAILGETWTAISSRATPSEREEEQQGQHSSNTGQSWQINKTALLHLRRHLNPLQTARSFVLSQDITAKKRRVPFVFSNKKSLYMKDGMYHSLPKVSPFSGRSLGVCSLVGNGGILTGSKCGEQIDSSDFVIRFNMAPVCQPYLDDIGRRTDLVTTSRDRMKSKFNSLNSRAGREKFVNHLHDQYGQDTYILSAPFTVRGNIGSLLGIPEVLTSHNSSAVALFINPSHVEKMLHIWRELGLDLSKGETNFSSGFYYASVALELCDQIHMYGFWPFREDREGRPVRYHYYKSLDLGGLNNRWHAMDKEYEKLLELHDHGVLQLISGNCR
ncbi:alpha-N-acetylneuraminide alpha-2,8-sialyltransferase-like [Branchiostoma floridae x Branchiostoma japonicum]